MKLISNILLIMWLIAFVTQLIARIQDEHRLRIAMAWVGLVFALVNLIIGVVMI